MQRPNESNQKVPNIHARHHSPRRAPHAMYANVAWQRIDERGDKNRPSSCLFTRAAGALTVKSTPRGHVKANISIAAFQDVSGCWWQASDGTIVNARYLKHRATVLHLCVYCIHSPIKTRSPLFLADYTQLILVDNPQYVDIVWFKVMKILSDWRHQEKKLFRRFAGASFWPHFSWFSGNFIRQNVSSQNTYLTAPYLG